jgi:phytoene dehydrogenase-like protein
MTVDSRTDKVKKQIFTSNYSGGRDYDLVIIGGGISGLTTGLLWLKNADAKKALILEKNFYTGGYVTTFERKGYVFETTQLIGDVRSVLDYLGLDIELRKYEGTWMRRLVVHGDEVDEYRIPVGPDNFPAYAASLFPDHERRIVKYMDYILSLFAQVRKLKVAPRFTDKMITPLVAPKVISCLSLTYSGLLDRFGLTDTKLRELLETFSAFAGVPPDRASSIQTTGAMISSMTNCYRPRGLFDELPIRMTDLYKDRGGELRLRAKVEKILTENGKAAGVMVKGDDEPIRARRIVTTIDPIVAMRDLVGEEQLPGAYVEKLKSTLMSVSSINVALGLDDDIDLSEADLDYPYNLVSTGLGTAEKLFDGFLAGDNAFSRDCFHVGVVCPSLTLGGRNTVTIRCLPFAMNGWREWRRNDRRRYKAERERWADFFIDIVERHFIKDLRKHIVVKNVATPVTYARYSGCPTGAIYDMASTVRQFGPRRLPLKTPISNLYQPKFSHGIYGAVMNGVQVVDVMLDRALNDGNSLFAPRS